MEVLLRLALCLSLVALPGLALAGDSLGGVEVGAPIVPSEWSVKLENGHYTREVVWGELPGLLEVEPCEGKVHMVRFATGYSSTPQVGTQPSKDPLADLVGGQLTVAQLLAADGWTAVGEGIMEAKPEGSFWKQTQTKGELVRVFTAVAKPGATMLGVETVPEAACPATK